MTTLNSPKRRAHTKEKIYTSDPNFIDGFLDLNKLYAQQEEAKRREEERKKIVA